jgi:hypothetical protein
MPNDDTRFPGRGLRSYPGFGDVPDKWVIDKIKQHAGSGEFTLFDVSFKTGSCAWLPYSEVRHTLAYADYLEAQGAESIYSLPRGSGIPPADPEINPASINVSDPDKPAIEDAHTQDSLEFPPTLRVSVLTMDNSIDEYLPQPGQALQDHRIDELPNPPTPMGMLQRSATAPPVMHPAGFPADHNGHDAPMHTATPAPGPWAPQGNFGVNPAALHNPIPLYLNPVAVPAEQYRDFTIRRQAETTLSTNDTMARQYSIMVEQDTARRIAEADRLARDKDLLAQKESYLLVRSRELDIQAADIKAETAKLDKLRAEVQASKKSWHKKEDLRRNRNNNRSYEHDVSESPRGRPRDRVDHTSPRTAEPNTRASVAKSPTHTPEPLRKGSLTAPTTSANPYFGAPPVHGEPTWTRLLPRPFTSTMLPSFGSTSNSSPTNDTGHTLPPILSITPGLFMPNDRPSSPVTTSGGQSDRATVVSVASPHRSRYARSKTPPYSPIRGNDRAES